MIRYVGIHSRTELSKAANVHYTDICKMLAGHKEPSKKVVSFFGLKKVTDGWYQSDVDGIL